MQDQAVIEAISFATPLGVFHADGTGAVVEASRRMEALLQTGRGGAVGAGWLACVDAQDRDRVAAAWGRMVETATPFDQEFCVRGPGSSADGHVRMQASPTLWGQPPQPGFIAVAGDVHARQQMLEQLRSANRFLERAERLSGVGGWEADLRTRTVKWTDQNCRIYDLEPGHQAGFSEHLRYFAAEPQRRMRQAARLALRTGRPWDLTLPMVTAKGRSVWVRSKGEAEFEDGRPVRLVGVLQDVTREQASGEALRQSEERLKRAMDASRLALWDLDLETGLGYLSENWSELMGQTRRVTVTDARELIGRVPRADQQRIGQALIAMLKGTAERYDVEHQVRSDDGRLLWIHSQGRVTQRNAQGRALRATGTNQDITARKLAEQELARAASITKATLDSTADGILVVSGEREILLFNQRLLEMLNIPADLQGASREKWGDVVVSQVKDPEAYTSRILALYGGPDTESFDVLEFKNGRVFERYGRPLALAGAQTGRVWSFRDVTARSRADAELKRAKEAAEAANRAKSDFLDTISHEIRTPLNGVLGMTRLLLEEPLQPQPRRYVELAASSAQSLLALINDMLDLGKIESGRMEFEHVEFSMVELARELGDLYGLRAREKGLAFDLRVDPAVPSMVVGDPGRLRQVLENLLSNALKFTEAGLVGLDIHPAPAAEGRVMLGFTVHDTGIGIPQEVQEGLFQRFFQADSSTTREYGGTGLGLAIVKQLCEQMGGRVTLNSEPGRGASFRCVLPFAPAAPRVAAPPSARVQSRTQRPPRPQRILVAEDNGTNQIVVKGMLKLVGYVDVTMVEDGQQVLDAVQREHFDAILMDCRMPVMDGYEATARLRAGGWRLPIIALTANVSDEQRRKCLAAGMDDFLSKPMESSQLAQMLDRWTAPPAEAAFDEKKALDRMDGDVELFRQVLDSFIDLAPKALERIGAALEEGDGPAVHRHLHSLAGSASMVSAEVLAKLARTLEEQALEGRTTGLDRGLVELHNAFDDFLLASAATIKERSP
jgi:PAS domain S-box-containing protein